MDEGLTELLSRGGFVSGQQIADALGVSRNAVWKAVERIRREGYEIEAVTGKGYRLSGRRDAFGENAVKEGIKTEYLGHEVIFFDRIDSTNDEIKRRADRGAKEGLLAVADVQDKGKGRRGRSWANPPGVNIAMSLLLRPDLSPNTAPMLTLVMAMACAEGIKKVTDLDALIKWPNDIVINGRKCVGILTEMTAEPDYIKDVIIGVGINVNNTDFPGEIEKTATSLYLESGKKQPRAQIASQIINSFEVLYDRFKEQGTLESLSDRYNSMCVNVGRRVCVMDPKGAYEADALGINDRGELRVRDDSGSESLVYAGEVSVRGIYGYAI